MTTVVFIPMQELLFLTPFVIELACQAFLRLGRRLKCDEPVPREASQLA